MVTYPRTDSQYVTEDIERNSRNAYEWDDRVSSILKSGQIGGNPERVINNAKVSDHHAILPTKRHWKMAWRDCQMERKI